MLEEQAGRRLRRKRVGALVMVEHMRAAPHRGDPVPELEHFRLVWGELREQGCRVARLVLRS